MAVLKLFKNGSSQAVRIPKAYEFPGDQVNVRPHGDGLLIEPVADDAATWAEIERAADRCDPGFLEKTPDDPPPEPLG